LEDDLNRNKMKWILMVLALSAIVVVGGCKKKQVPPAPPAAPPPAPPQATLSVTPESVDLGGSATITWSTQNATTANIEGIGPVQPSGTQRVTPSTSTTYRLTATGPGGSADATARLTVVQPPPPPAQATPQAAAPETTEAALFASSVKDVYFGYDSFELSPEGQSAVDSDAAFLKAHRSIRFTIEGHCDERGSTEYNLALGDNRANAARNALVKAGVAADQIKVISYGKEKPFCNESNESCWQQNRRAHFAYGQ
jgi:peptidoglycan-associated lipoprotein